MARPAALTAFDNVKDQIGCCGIWCGSCVIGNGVLRELSQRYERLIADYGLEEWDPRDVDYEEFLHGLRSMQEVPLCPGCRRGGGRTDCELRACAQSRSLEYCGDCRESSDCPHTELLQHMRSGALQAGLLVESGAIHRDELPQRWMAEVRRRWPGTMLFDDAG